ncbi:MAG: toxin-antitoxin system HicB family antitoxin [Spirochaetae bacterium HGW-Spirochaetae-10]|nr:MAG: toxin-antitoxin system HicB family antitoxin [Spirochaetae bacterium HGW-Spirochaetae-10]
MFHPFLRADRNKALFIENNPFLATVHFNADDEVFFGKIEQIDDLVSFEGRSVVELKRAFRSAVEDYLDICERFIKPVFKSYKGSFNARIEPDLHRQAVRHSIARGISLNQLIRDAIRSGGFLTANPG